MAASAPRLGLSRITSLLKALGDPHLEVPIVHVAGTNGKGSICAYLDSIFRCAGLRTGRFNSPHLIEPNDSILIDGSPVAASTFREVSTRIEGAGEEASPFEQLTAVAFSIFAETRPKLDVAVVEVGLGGRDDATNVCPAPLATVLGPVDLDHQALLGTTVADIARVKCGIFKTGIPAVLSSQSYPAVVNVARSAAESISAPLFLGMYGDWEKDGRLKVALGPKRHIRARPGLPGRYQRVNAAVAAQTAALLRERDVFPKISDEHIKQGIEQAEWPGRLSHLRIPDIAAEVIVDGAHNPSAARQLQMYLESLSREPLVLIIAVSTGRDPSALLEPVLKHSKRVRRVITTTFSVPVEGMPWVQPLETASIVQAAERWGVQATECESVQEALREAAASEAQRIVVYGSLYLVADVYRLLRGRMSG